MIKLEYLQKTYGHLDKQDSEEWKKKRKERLGASQLKYILKYKKYKHKIDPVMCQWGHLGESIAKKYLKSKDFPEIHEFGSIPSSKFPISFSPDGLFVRNDELGAIEIKTSFCKDYFKWKDHIDQIQCGLNLLPLDYIILIHFKIRRCSKEDFYQKGKYDVLFHKPWTKKYYFKIRNAEEEQFKGYLHWNGEFEQGEGICLDRKPNEIVIQNDLDLENMKWKGTRMFFKCFRIEWYKFTENKKWLHSLEEVWDIYSHFKNNTEPSN